MEFQDFSQTPAKPSNRTTYLLLLGTLVAGSALLYHRVREQQKSLTLRELMPPDAEFYGRSADGARVYEEASALPTLVKTSGAADRGAASVYPHSPAYSPAVVTVARPSYGEAVASAPMAESPSAPAAEKTNWRVVAYELAETLLLTLFIFVLMRTFIINYRIEGSSMEPNLHEGQHLIVSKVNYYVGEPERGDVIVFEYPYSLPQEEKDYIKRVIGVPGDTVECRPGEIVVNGQVIEEPYQPNPWSYTCTPTTLQENEYFVLGDNRSASSDSHQWGVLERKYIIGKAYFAYWPPSQVEVVPNADIIAPEPSVPVVQN